MFTGVAATFYLLALPLLALSAQDECGTGLKPYCCSKSSSTPRGYVGEQCTTLQSTNDPCATSVLCCQQDDGVSISAALPPLTPLKSGA
ncbi:hypothetical protein FPV67DRAFT_1677946 [Lyophyllum atratum]|nr:hypothetical protein FPV67DRAFT_1677946 [Lyophyllum atratum]